MEFPKSIQNQIEELKKCLKLNKEQTGRLIEIAEKQYEKSRISPGEAAGVVAAQSLGEPGTQLTMRTKWMSGASDVTISSGLPRIIEIFDAKKEATTPAMTIFLKRSVAKSESKVESIAMKIIEIKLEEVSKEINVDLLRMRVEVDLDPDKLAHYNLSEEEVYKKVEDAFKAYKITTGKYKINVKPKEEEMDIKKLYKFRVKLRELHVSGIKGISQVLPIKQGEDWIVKTAGSNLSAVLRMKEVDPENTMTNDIFETFHTLGIEAARNVIIHEIQIVLKGQGIEVDSRHIMLVADAMTATGKILSIGRYGLSGVKQSVLSRASFEVPLKHLFNAAMYGEEDHLLSVIENVMLNQPVPVGTGIVKLKVTQGKDLTKK